LQLLFLLSSSSSIIIVFITLMLLTILYYMEYSVPNNTKSIENYLEKYVEGENVKLLDMKKIDNYYPILFKFNKNTLAEATLEKGINGRLKIAGTHYAEEDKITSTGFGTNKAQYQVILGKNPGNIKTVILTDGINVYPPKYKTTIDNYLFYIHEIPVNNNHLKSIFIDLNGNQISKPEISRTGRSSSIANEEFILHFFILISAMLILLKVNLKR